jgi:carboxymethylenebutenolidase
MPPDSKARALKLLTTVLTALLAAGVAKEGVGAAPGAARKGAAAGPAADGVDEAEVRSRPVVARGGARPVEAPGRPVGTQDSDALQGTLRGMIARGLVRQAGLLAARDEPGPATRDAVRGDAPEAEPPAPVEETKTTFFSRRKKIAVERFEPKIPASYPAVIVLHGAGGIGDDPRSMVRERARELARAGFVALLPHFFDRTGTKFNNPYRNREFFRAWTQTVHDTVTYAATLPTVDRRRIGLLGFSLGAYVAMSEALFDSRVSAVVEYSGALLDELAGQLERMPPTLILHGEADRIVPVLEARRLAGLFEARQVRYEISIYKGAGHDLSGDDGKDAWRRSLTFLDKHLRGGP